MGLGTSSPRVPPAIAAELVDPSAYADGRIHRHYRWLRAHIPLGVAEPDGFDPFWVVTRHVDILAVSSNNEIFRSGDLPTALSGRAFNTGVRRMNGGSPHLIRSLIEMDPPDHMKYRALTQAWFKPANMRNVEGQIREVARAAVHSLVMHGGRGDFVTDLVEAYPLGIIMRILGLPEVDKPQILRLTKQMFGAQDPEAARPVDPLEAKQYPLGALPAVIADFARYFRAVCADRRACSRDDLATVIANAQIDGGPIPDLEAASYYTIFATAGHHTVSFAIAGALQALAESPGELARLKADASLIPDLVNEALRWTTPAKTFMRSAAIDVELGGHAVARGDWLMLCYASGNRDEAVFAAPDLFRMDRSPNRHLSFGYGPHMCLGQHLAKLQMRILFEELLPRLASIEPAGKARLLQSWFVNGLKSLPVRFSLA